MRTPEPTWQTTYRHDRRAHRHRCAGCNRIINEGESVLMCRTVAKKSRAAHTECAAKLHGVSGRWTLADAMAAWGTEYLRSCGWKIEPHPMSRVEAA